MSMQFDNFIDSLSNLYNITAREDDEMLQEVKPVRIPTYLFKC